MRPLRPSILGTSSHPLMNHFITVPTELTKIDLCYCGEGREVRVNVNQMGLVKIARFFEREKVGGKVRVLELEEER